MKKAFFSLLIITLLVLPLPYISAWDWGLLMDQTAGLESVAGGEVIDGFSYIGTLIPWFSTPLRDAGSFYLSGGASLEYDSGKPIFVPELLRTEFNYRIREYMEISAGRIPYTDPVGFIASGLFDGARLSLDTGYGNVGVGFWYTGLLYKKNAQITMTGNDMAIYTSTLDYTNFMDTYFSSRRLVAAIDWEYLDIKEWLSLKLAFIGQFDLNGQDEKYHSQYLAAKASIPVRNFAFNIGGTLEFMEITGISQQFKIGLAGELGAAWMPPSSIPDQLSLTARFSSGTFNSGNTLAAFVPITTEAQGDVLSAKLSGLSMIRLEYSARLHDTFSINVASSYFILSDLATYKGPPPGREGHFLGNEFSGRLTWSPFSDLRLSLGGGIFLPFMGNADKGDPVWRINLNALVVIF